MVNCGEMFMQCVSASFGAQNIKYTITVANIFFICRGRRIQALSWTTEGFSAAKLKKQEMEKQGRDLRDLRVKQQLSLTKIDEIKKPQFELIPNKCVLEPYQSCTVTMKGCSEV